MGLRAGYISNRDGIVRSGPLVDDLLTKIQDLEEATHETSGLLSNLDKAKLDNLEDRYEELSDAEIEEACTM